MKRFIWTVLATVVSGVGAAYSLRLLEHLWGAVTHEPPPPATKRWTRWLVAGPLERRVKHRVHPGNP